MLRRCSTYANDVSFNGAAALIGNMPPKKTKKQKARTAEEREADEQAEQQRQQREAAVVQSGQALLDRVNALQVQPAAAIRSEDADAIQKAHQSLHEALKHDEVAAAVRSKGFSKLTSADAVTFFGVEKTRLAHNRMPVSSENMLQSIQQLAKCNESYSIYTGRLYEMIRTYVSSVVCALFCYCSESYCCLRSAG